MNNLSTVGRVLSKNIVVKLIEEDLRHERGQEILGLLDGILEEEHVCIKTRSFDSVLVSPWASDSRSSPHISTIEGHGTWKVILHCAYGELTLN